MRRAPEAPLAARDAPSPYRRPQRNQALRRSRRRRFMRRGAWGGVMLLGGVVILGWAGVACAHWLVHTPLLAVQAVLVEDVRHADAERLREVLSRWRGENLLGISLDQVRIAMIKEDWVEDAMVRRVLPTTPAVRIFERQAEAVAVLAGALTLVDGRGTPIVTWSPRLGAVDLPLITGAPDGPAGARAVRAALGALEQFRRKDPALLANLAEIDPSRPDRFTVRFIDEPAPVYLSRERVTENLDRYFAVREDIRGRLGTVQAIDLRWRGRVVVVPETATSGQGAALDNHEFMMRKANRDG